MIENATSNRVRVLPLAADEVQESDIFYAGLIAVATQGYRSRHVGKMLAGHWGSAWLFLDEDLDASPTAEILAFWANIGIQEPILNEPQAMRDRIQETVKFQLSAARVRGEQDPGPVRFAVDVSCMSRSALALVVDAFRILGDERLAVDFFYSDGAYEAPPNDDAGAVLVNGPLEGFRGWAADPSAPLLMVLGVGFEGISALAAVETLEPTNTLVLFPDGIDPRFDVQVEAENLAFMAFMPREPVHYEVGQPYLLYRNLRSTVAFEHLENRVVIVPLGPKVFTLVALLVACEFEDITVWRISISPAPERSSHMTSGTIVGLAVTFVND